MVDDAPIVEFFVRNPGVARRLLAEHVNDGSGHCHTCITREQGARSTWPCRLHYYAARASAAP